MSPVAAEPLIVECSREAETVRAVRSLRGAETLDARCAHVVVRDGHGGPVLAAARLLTPADALEAGGFQSTPRYDLRRVLLLPGRILEFGRVCVVAGRRQGPALEALWPGLARAARDRGADHLFGGVAAHAAREGQPPAVLASLLRLGAEIVAGPERDPESGSPEYLLLVAPSRLAAGA